MKYAHLLFITLLFAACTKDNFEDWGNGAYMPSNGDISAGGGTSSATGLMSLTELSDFTVEANTSSLSETEQIPTDEADAHYNDYLENNFEAKNTVSIAFNGTADATVTDIVSGDTVTVSGGKVEVHAHSKGLVLRVTGTTTDGWLKVYSEKKFELLLADATITNPSGAAINIQDGNCFMVLSGANALSDGTSATYLPTTLVSEYANAVTTEDEKAVLFAEDDLRISGTGSLAISSSNTSGKAGISADDAVFVRPGVSLQVTCTSGAGNGIKANDDITVRGGVINLQTAAAGSKGLSSDGSLSIEGGRITAITTGGTDTSVASDPSGCAAIKADSVMTVSGGELWLKSTGQGGKGISCDQALTISGGKLRIITTGSKYGSSSSSMGGGMGRPGQSTSSSSNSVSPKGIKGDANITITGGDIMVRTSGSNAEGIESKQTLAFSGGKTAVSAYDDGLNADKAINVSGGYVFAVSTGQADGIDSNGSITVSGGTIIGIASTSGSEEGIDLENATFAMQNATVISISNSSMGMGASYSGHYVSSTISGNSGSICALTDGSTPLVVFALPRQYSNARLLLSAPTLKSGSYTFLTGATATGGTQWMNLYEGSTVSGGSSTSVTAK